jgi:hypothetical protein
MNKKKKTSRLKHRKNQARIKNLIRASRLKAKPKKVEAPKEVETVVQATEEAIKPTEVKKSPAKKPAAKKKAPAKKPAAKKKAPAKKSAAKKKAPAKKPAAKKKAPAKKPAAKKKAE